MVSVAVLCFLLHSGIATIALIKVYPEQTIYPVEGWHRAFQSNVGAHHPSFWSFVDVIKREQFLFRTIVLQLRAGQPPAKRRRKYDRLDERLVRLVSEYDATKVLEFL